MDTVYESRESNVRSYCRMFSAEFHSAQGTNIRDTKGNIYLDFFSGCGSLNYGHNHPVLKDALINYIQASGLSMSLDLHSNAKRMFMSNLQDIALAPRGLDYKMQFTGPTGANAVEAAIKLARKVTGRWNIVAFTNGFHGCSLGALAATGSSHHRGASAPLLSNVTRQPYDGYFGPEIDTAAQLEKLLDDPSSGIDKPAAFIVEGLQGEGGLNAARPDWLRAIARIAKERGILLILDEIQTGFGRSGDLFSFQQSGITPDVVTLAKSVSGFGLPMAMVLFRPELDCWEPGEHNGTFRGNNLAFVTGSAALTHFWSSGDFMQDVREKSDWLAMRLTQIASAFDLTTKGRGMMQGIDVVSPDLCTAIRKLCYERGLLVEAAGPRDEVLKLMPPLTVTQDELEQGLSIVQAAFEQTFARTATAAE